MARQNNGMREPVGKPRTGTQRSQLRTWIAGGAVFALVATIAVIASGYDARDTPREEPGVWVTRDTGQYARVNTDTGEIDLVRKVTEPSAVAQSGGSAVLFSHGNGRAWPISAANPLDFADDAEVAADTGSGDEESGSESSVATVSAEESADQSSGGTSSTAVEMPDGTREMVSAGRYVAIRTESGGVYIGELADADDLSGLSLQPEQLASRLESLRPVAPVVETDGAGAGDDGVSDEGADGGAPSSETDITSTDTDGYRADAIALDESGELVLVSSGEDTIRRYSAVADEFVGDPTALPAGVGSGENLQAALVGDDWVLLDAENGLLWRSDETETPLEISDVARLQASSSGSDAPGLAGDTVLIADGAGLIQVPRDGDPERIAEATGVAARPTEVDGKRYAAWLGPQAGALWSAGNDVQSLDIDESVQDQGEFDPVIRTNGSRAVLNDTRTGLLWTLPDGDAIPLEQWSISDPPKENRGTVVVEDVTEQVPPTAVDDAFGVRPGEPVSLPVMLNDYDANKRDVLTVAAESLGESPLPEEFGRVEMLPDGQALTVHTAADATGSATFQYRVTDGMQQSELATVTLTVADDSVNTAPEWCPVDGCQRTWRVPSIVPGGTLVYPLLDGWVDPEGDVTMLASVEAVRDDEPIRTIVTADGRLALRHTDPNAGASEIPLKVTVRDSRGEEQERELQLSVRADAPAEFEATAATVKIGQEISVNPLSRVAGGSGSYALTDAVIQTGGDKVQVTPQLASGMVSFSATVPGEATVSLSIRDTVTGNEITGLMRVSATPNGSPLTFPSLRAFVRPLSDSMVEVLAAIPSAKSRALAVTDATVLDGQLRADVLAHSSVRVAGTTADGGPGRVGAIDVTVSEGEALGSGRLTVFQVPESGGAGAIAVADTATVRVGDVVDIPVLDNDVASPGERLLLHPEIIGSDTKGELAFASGSVLRYLAPKTAGTYRLSYTTYGASSPESSDVGAVLVTVLPSGSNRDPEPQALTARVAPGEQTEVRVPLSNIDPDGDRVRLASVDAAEDPQLTVNLAASGSGISVGASSAAEPGTYRVNYEVRDGSGGSGAGITTVIVTPSDQSSGAPVAVTDYVRMVPGSGPPATVFPLNNDVDPARGKLTVLGVEPNVAGGPDSAEYRRLEKALDVKDLKKGIVSVTPGSQLGTVSYKYTIKSSATSSTVDGLIVVQTSDRVGVQAPSVDDTVLNVRERSQLESDGVDVVTDRVRWSTGDVSSLKLSLWGGNDGDYRVEGNRIIGEYNPDGDLVVFRLTGTDITGTEVSSYGFLTIPSLDGLRLTLKPGLEALSVDEEKSVSARVNDLVDLGAGDHAELRQSAFAVGRAAASCTATSSDTLRYSAGTEAPWNDVCVIDVRLAGQKTWTSLPIPVAIVPKSPVAQLESLTRTIAPGTKAEISLADMVNWQGGREGKLSDLKYSVAGGGSAFEVSPSGATVTVEANAGATPGIQEVLTVSVRGAGESQAPLSLRVGEAPQDVPRGATVALQCTVGSECGANVVGVSGEHDPFAGKQGGGLKLVSVNAEACAVGSFSKASDSSIAVSWASGAAAGTTCTVPFTVEDAQGRTGTGSIEFDALGLPGAPASITQTGYDASSATFTVTLGGQQAHPAVTAVTLSGGGNTSCVPTGPSAYQCVASGLANGVKHQFSARAVNAVGESSPSSSVVAWAYASPAAPNVSATPLKNPNNTDATSGGLSVAISGSADTGSYQISIGGIDMGAMPGPSAQREFTGLAAGPIAVRVTPVTNLEVPNIGGGSTTGEASETHPVVLGAPIIDRAVLTSTGEESARITTTGKGSHNGEAVKYSFAVSRVYQSPDCVNGGQDGQNFSGLKRARFYHGAACASSDYGQTIAYTEAVRISEAVQPLDNVSYAVGPAPVVGGNGTSASYGLTSEPQPGAINGATVQYQIDGAVVTEFTPSINEILIRQCLDPGDEESCSEWRVVEYSGAPITADISVIPEAAYDAASPPVSALEMVAANGSLNSSYTAGTPTGAEGSQVIPITFSWTGAFSGLDPVTLNVPYIPPEIATPPAT